jgi:hypothetical protein
MDGVTFESTTLALSLIRLKMGDFFSNKMRARFGVRVQLRNFCAQRQQLADTMRHARGPHPYGMYSKLTS